MPSPKFKPGNKIAAGNPGPFARGRPITSVIIQKLNEVDKSTGRENIWELVDALFALAKGGERKVRVRENGKFVTKIVNEKPDLAAIREISDRAEGRPIQTHGLDAESGTKVTLVFEPTERDA